MRETEGQKSLLICTEFPKCTSEKMEGGTLASAELELKEESKTRDDVTIPMIQHTYTLIVSLSKENDIR